MDTRAGGDPGPEAAAGLAARSPSRYGQASLADLAVTLARAFGRPADGPGLGPDLYGAGRPIDARRLAGARSVVLIVLDGAGSSALSAHVPGGAVCRGLRATLDSVFPSSTAPAITGLLTARPPLAHGNSGWFLWNESAQRMMRTLPLDWRDAPGEPVPAWPFAWSGWMDAGVDAVAIQPVEIYDSVFSRHALAAARRVGYAGHDAFVERIVEAVRAPLRHGRRFVYAYAPDFDTVSHAAGWRSEPAGECLRALDARIGQVVDRLAGDDVLVLVTADHGFCDVPADRQLDLASYPGLAAELRAPLAGEPRVAFCHVRPGRRDAFIERARSALDGLAEVHASDALVAAGWFGRRTGPAGNPAAFGDVTLVMAPGTAIGDRVPGERPLQMIGMHGGPSADEMSIPLAVFDGRAL